MNYTVELCTLLRRLIIHVQAMAALSNNIYVGFFSIYRDPDDFTTEILLTPRF